jgi:drug/metabolite transporter (DMT)-like permease
MTPSQISARKGVLLVGGSALAWSFGGTIARFISETDSWTVVFWRSVFATAFLLGFLVWRDGVVATMKSFKSMEWPGYLVAGCFAVASTSFIVALSFTTVANILLMQAGVPLLAALMSWLVFGERVSSATWMAIAAVISGVAIMVSQSLTGQVSPIGDGLSLLIAVMFSLATVITRRHSDVRMTPAVCLGTAIAGLVSAMLASHHTVTLPDLAWLVAFGAINLGAGLAMFAMGARMVPAALAALIGVLEPVLGPIWVWLVHNEVPNFRTIIGGGVVFVALLTHLATDWWRTKSVDKT